MKMPRPIECPHCSALPPAEHHPECMYTVPVPPVTEDDITRLMDEAWPDGHRAMAKAILGKYDVTRK